MTNGGVTTVFTPRVDDAAGKIEILIGRPAGAPGVSGAGFLASVVFNAIAAGNANLSMTVTALTPSALPVPTQVAPVSVVVK